MLAKKFNNKLLVRIDQGEEIIKSLKKICAEHGVRLGSIQGIGATNKAKIGLFDVSKKEYYSRELTGNYEIAPLAGNITEMDGEIYLHLHINLCDAEHRSLGGHLNYAVVSATFEGAIDIIDGQVNRILDESTGLNLLDL